MTRATGWTFRRTGPYRFIRYDTDDKVVLSSFDGFWKGPGNAGLVVKVIPDDTMRGLDLRKGSTDLVVNDLPPDIVHQLTEDGSFHVVRLPASTSPISASTCAIRSSAIGA